MTREEALLYQIGKQQTGPKPTPFDKTSEFIRAVMSRYTKQELKEILQPGTEVELLWKHNLGGGATAEFVNEEVCLF